MSARRAPGQTCLMCIGSGWPLVNANSRSGCLPYWSCGDSICLPEFIVPGGDDMVTGPGLQGANRRNNTITKMQIQWIGPSPRSRGDFQHFGVYDMPRKLSKLGNKTTIHGEVVQTAQKGGRSTGNKEISLRIPPPSLLCDPWDPINLSEPQFTAP